MVLSNVNNLIEASKREIKIEVLANGNSVEKYSEITSASDDIELMKRLSKEDVGFAACNNSLNGLKLDKDQIFDFVTIVPAGVLELTIKQGEGYAYIKP